jgi:VCBS repeat-containing protein
VGFSSAAATPPPPPSPSPLPRSATPPPSPATPTATEDDTTAVAGNLDATDVDGPADSWTAAGDTTTYGSYTLSANGAWTYTLDNTRPAVQALAAGAKVTDTFTAVTADGVAQLVTITVTGVNDAPTAVRDFYRVAPGATLIVAAPGVLANDSDAEGDALTVMRTPSSSLVIQPDGSFTYTAPYVAPGTGYGFSFLYQVTDGTSSSNVWIEVYVYNG